MELQQVLYEEDEREGGAGKWDVHDSRTRKVTQTVDKKGRINDEDRRSESGLVEFGVENTHTKD